jgi:hypothetical protein
MFLKMNEEEINYNILLQQQINNLQSNRINELKKYLEYNEKQHILSKKYYEKKMFLLQLIIFLILCINTIFIMISFTIQYDIKYNYNILKP